MKHLVRHPDSAQPEEFTAADEWVRAQKAFVDSLWQAVPSENHRADVTLREIIENPKIFEIGVDLEFAKARKLTIDQCRELSKSSGVWGAFFAQIGYALAMTMRDRYSKGKARKMPNTLDILQLIYLGVANRFVTDDEAFYQAACEVRDVLPCGADVFRPAPLFARLGFPLPSRVG